MQVHGTEVKALWLKLNFSILLIWIYETYPKAVLCMKWIAVLLDLQIFGCICTKNAYYLPS